MKLFFFLSNFFVFLRCSYYSYMLHVGIGKVDQRFLDFLFTNLWSNNDQLFYNRINHFYFRRKWPNSRNIQLGKYYRLGMSYGAPVKMLYVSVPKLVLIFFSRPKTEKTGLTGRIFSGWTGTNRNRKNGAFQSQRLGNFPVEPEKTPIPDYKRKIALGNLSSTLTRDPGRHP